MGHLVCPYCYTAFAERQIAFRCAGLKGRNGRQCGRVRDPVLENQMGITAGVPPAFTANGRRLSATCPSCDNETTTRICPHCHSELPVGFGRIEARLIAMVGAKNSGKTVYLTVLMNELMNRVGQRFDAAVMGSDEHTRRAFDGDKERLYHHKALPDVTRTAVADRRPPLVFRFSLNGRRPRHTLMSFFDTAGEDLETKRGVTENARYLASASGIILLLDPVQMPGARDSAGPGAPLPPLRAGVDSPHNVLTRVTELLESAPGARPGRPVAVPVAVAFSKIDTMWDTLAASSPLRQPAPDRPAFDGADSRAVHEHVQALLHTWDGGQIDQLLTTHYRHFRYFAVSALGANPTANGKVSGRGIHPHRVEDPLLWLLSHLKVIPTAEG